jgi:hypothetical protein
VIERRPLYTANQLQRASHSSPSRYACVAPSKATADAIAGYCASNRARCASADAPCPIQPGVHLYPSNLISCSHSGPSGGASTSWESCGAIQSGRAAAGERRATGRAMP